MRHKVDIKPLLEKLDNFEVGDYVVSRLNNLYLIIAVNEVTYSTMNVGVGNKIEVIGKNLLKAFQGTITITVER